MWLGLVYLISGTYLLIFVTVAIIREAFDNEQVPQRQDLPELQEAGGGQDGKLLEDSPEG